uniref:hypothetical protein n=1 Tax=Enterocloster clostridioformis TaxID=1531 RepID=UPI002ED632C6
MLWWEWVKASGPTALYFATHSLKDVEEQFFSLYVIPYFSQTWADEYFPDKKSSQAWILISGGNFGLDIKIPLK